MNMRATFATALALIALAAPAVADGAAAQGPKLTLVFPGERQTLVVGFGNGATAHGKLVGADGAPLAGAELHVLVRQRRDGAQPVDTGTINTSPDGTFTITLPKGPSRELTVDYRTTPQDPTPAATATARLSVRAGVRLRASPRRLRTGQLLRLSGELRGGPQPAAGKLVQLQVRRAGVWRTFADVKARKGSFAFRYRFSQIKTTRRLRFRAVVPPHGSYPYTRGVSPSVLVMVAGAPGA